METKQEWSFRGEEVVNGVRRRGSGYSKDCWICSWKVFGNPWVGMQAEDLSVICTTHFNKWRHHPSDCSTQKPIPSLVPPCPSSCTSSQLSCLQNASGIHPLLSHQWSTPSILVKITAIFACITVLASQLVSQCPPSCLLFKKS